MKVSMTLPAGALAAPRPILRAGGQARLLGVALALGGAVDLLFYGQQLGVSALVFVLLLLGALGVLGRQADIGPVRRNLWLIAPLLFFAAMIGVRANLFLTVLNGLAVLVLLGLLATFYADGRVERLGLLGYPVLLLWTLGNALAQAAPLVPASIDLPEVQRRALPRLVPMARGVLLALPVLGVFTILLAMADLVFARFLSTLLGLEFLRGLPELAMRGLIILGAAWAVAGGLAYALHRRNAFDGEELAQAVLAELPGMLTIGAIEATTLLVLVDALFLVFGWIQFAYLFGGQANITLDGYTYADYARRGFFELVAVAVLTLGLGLGLHWLTWRETRGQRVLFNLLSSGMVGLTLVLLASALQRMVLYEAAYGYTHLRLYVHLFMVWLAVVFVWFMITLWLRPNRFAIGAFLTALGFLASLNAINPDATIAAQNLARYQATGQVDAIYLAQLSADAVPVLAPALPQLPGDAQVLLRAGWRARLAQMDHDPGWREWPAFHLARQEAYAVLDAHRAELQAEPATSVP